MTPVTSCPARAGTAWTWLFGLGLCLFVVLLFPAGSLPSRRWRPVAWAAGAGLAGWVLADAFAPTIITADSPVPNPVGVNGTPGRIFTAWAGARTALLAVTGLAAVLSLVFRYRRARAAERAQLRWLVYSGGVIVVAFLAEILAEKVIGPGATANRLQTAMGSGAAALIPVAIGVAVLRCGGGCSAGWTGGSTAPGTTPTRSRPPSPPG